jgi:hypothetical protein
VQAAWWTVNRTTDARGKGPLVSKLASPMAVMHVARTIDELWQIIAEAID